MKILTVGDVVSQPGLQTVEHVLRRVKKQVGADFTIVNGENASGVGITPKQADAIFDAGARHYIGQSHVPQTEHRHLFGG